MPAISSAPYGLAPAGSASTATVCVQPADGGGDATKAEGQEEAALLGGLGDDGGDILGVAVELGAAAIHPVITRRCVADKLNLERARAITTEAAEQCARTALPVLADPVKLDALLASWPEGRALFFADEQGGEPAAAAFAAHTGPAAILIGPEGGFDDTERAAIRAHHAARPITRGPRILRGETAAIAGLAMWMAVAGDW